VFKLKLQQKAGFPTTVVGIENAGLQKICKTSKCGALHAMKQKRHEFFC
jgi:hypothetical protein